MDDGTAAELADEKEPDVQVNYGSGWVSAIGGPLMVGVLLLVATRCSDGDVDREKALADLRVELKGVTTELAGVKTQLQQLVQQPYERREDHDRDISRLERRIGDIERAQLERRQR